MCNAVIPGMMERNHGHVISMNSTMGHEARGGKFIAYLRVTNIYLYKFYATNLNNLNIIHYSKNIYA